MANTLAEVVNALTQVRIGISVANAIGITVPPILLEFESDATKAISGLNVFGTPSSLSNDLNDITQAAGALSGLVSAPSLTDIVEAIQKVKATASNLSSGQLAIIGLVYASFDGIHDRVVVACYRESGQFAKIVDSGTTDTASLNPTKEAA